MPTFLGHIPLARLVDGMDEVDLPVGRLRAVPFAEWQKIDFYQARRRHYEATAPVFFEVEIARSGKARHESEAEALRELDRLHRALVVATAAAPFPSPRLSMGYVTQGRARSVRAGPCGRELVVNGFLHTTVPLYGATIERLTELQPLLREAGPADPGIDALVRTTRPGFGSLNEALHLLSGLEAVLVTHGEPLTRSFSRRYSTLAGVENAREYEQLGRDLYSLRSALVHGRDVSTRGRDLYRYLGEQNRILTCWLVCRVLRWARVHPGETCQGLQTALDLAYEDPDSFRQFLVTVGD